MRFQGLETGGHWRAQEVAVQFSEGVENQQAQTIEAVQVSGQKGEGFCELFQDSMAKCQFF